MVCCLFDEHVYIINIYVYIYVYIQRDICMHIYIYISEVGGMSSDQPGKSYVSFVRARSCM